MRWWRLRRDEPAPAPREPEDEPGLHLERETIAPGEVVRGLVVMPGEGGDDVQVALRFHERSGEYDVVAAELTDPEPRREQLPGRVGYRFAIELPSDALPSCTAPHGELGWTVDASGSAIESEGPFSRPIEVVVESPQPAVA